jgi:hypothetical protein
MTEQRLDRVGDDWTAETPLNQILHEINKAMEAKLESQGYARKVMIAIPAKQIEMLCHSQAPGSPRLHPFTCWDYILESNLLASTEVEYEFLPRYSFKDLEGAILAKLSSPDTASVSVLERRI